MERTVFGFITAYSKREQIVLLVVTLASFPFLFYTLELPKIIINDAITGDDHIRQFLGYSFEQLHYLLFLCVFFLLLVLFNGSFKYFINVYRGRMAELLLRRIRYALYSRVLRFPLPHFSKLSQGEIVSIITAEAEPLGGFFGVAFSLPVYQGGVLITILGFIAIQDPFMGIAAISLYPLQMWIIPKLQSHVNILAKKRVMNVRKVSENIGQTVEGVYEVHANDTSQYELASLSALLGRNFNIRMDIYKKKFFIKFINNFIAQITPFFFYLIGGYLVIKGDLSFGALVASLAAYKDLADPWKELLAWYQLKEDTRIKYEQLVERFHPDGLMEESLQLDEPNNVLDLKGGPITTANLGWQDDGGVKTVDGVSLNISPGEKVLLVGGGGSGKEHLARMMAGILSPTTGNIRITDHNMALMPESITGRQIGYASSESFIFNGTISENLLYSLKHRPALPSNLDPEQALKREDDVKMSLQAGNSGYDPHADWINYQVAGVSGPQQMSERIINILQTVGLDEDIYEMGLQRRVNPAHNEELCTAILSARSRVCMALEQPEISNLVEHFDVNSYNVNASVAENLLFGTPIGEKFSASQIAQNAYVHETLEKNNLLDEFVQMGVKTAAAMTDLFSDLPPGHEFLERYGFINSDELLEFQSILSRVERDGIEGINTDDYSKLLTLPFNLVVARHRLGIVGKDMHQKILAARQSFRENLPESLKDSIDFFDVKSYNANATIQDNILFGRLSYSQRDAEERIGALIHEAVNELGIYKLLMKVGLELSAGIGGRRLAQAQRQKIALARCLLKRPDVLIMDEAFSALEMDEKKTLLQRVLAEIGNATVLFIDTDDTLSEYFDRKLLMKNGRVTAADGHEIDTGIIDQHEEDTGSLAEEVRFLRQVSMLDSFDTSTLKLMAFTSKRLTFEPGEEVFQQGEKGDTAYIIIDGQGEVLINTSDGETPIRDIYPNEIIGEIALLSDVPRTATVRVNKRMTVLELSKPQFFALIERDNRIVLEMLKQMSARLERTTAKLSAS